MTAMFLLLLLLIYNVYPLDYGTCDDPFIIFKHTVATSDSARECENYSKIFIDIHDEGANKFNDGQCAHQCKLELPYTCFKIHAPQTQFEQGLLNINTFENKLSTKWKYAIEHNKYNTFFDDSISFWVNSLDEYILHWQSNNVKFDYIGIEWNLYDININDNNFKNNKFYSILIHSSQSARQFEFISYIKPNLYNSIQWITDDIPRCTFKLQNNPYPWDRNDKATIVPIRISQPTTNINKMYDFYKNILGANLIYYANGMQSNSKTIFMELINTHIEMQFIERNCENFDDFTFNKYENLLMETHESIITNQYCGQDRWMDNHFAYETYVIPGLLDTIYYNLNVNNIKFTVHKNTKEHVSNYIKHQLELINYNGQYTFGLWVIQPNGQSIKMGGVVSEPSVAYYANINDPQWCPKACNWGLVQGTVDMTHVYIDDENGSEYLDTYMNVDIDSDNTSEIVVRYHKHRSYAIYVVFAVLLLGFVALVFHYLWYYVCDKQTINICDCDPYIPI